MIRLKYPNDQPPIECEVISDPVEIAKWTVGWDDHARNVRWYQERQFAIARENLGKYVCVAGGELFVSDQFEEAISAAKAKHPDDRGLFFKHIPANLQVPDR